ncbi:hypothetical protein [Pseudoalteromonas marina]
MSDANEEISKLSDGAECLYKALVFDCASSVFKWLGRVFDIPLVARKSD